MTQHIIQKWYTGRVDGTIGPVEHESERDAEEWIGRQSLVDPDGVTSGHYYLDGPEEE